MSIVADQARQHAIRPRWLRQTYLVEWPRRLKVGLGEKSGLPPGWVGVASCRFGRPKNGDSCWEDRDACTSLGVWTKRDGLADGDSPVRRRRGTGTFCGSSHSELE